MIYDTIIIGGGPAGITAALYCGRAKLNILLIEQGSIGGQMLVTNNIENYPGTPGNISGYSLSNYMENQIKHFDNIQKITVKATKLILDNKIKSVQTITNKSFNSKTIIIATGARARTLNCPGEKEFRGMGVSYCAICDSAFYNNAKNIVFVGGGNSAIQEALNLTKFAQIVTIVHRRNKLRATKFLQDRAFNNPKINFCFNSVIESINGTEIVESITIKNTVTGEKSIHNTEGIFIYLGMIPNTEIFSNLLNIDEEGYIIANETTKTNINGIFTAGDCRKKLLKQIVTATSDGAIAAKMVEQYIEQNNE